MSRISISGKFIKRYYEIIDDPRYGWRKNILEKAVRTRIKVYKKKMQEYEEKVKALEELLKDFWDEYPYSDNQKGDEPMN